MLLFILSIIGIDFFLLLRHLKLRSSFLFFDFGVFDFDFFIVKLSDFGPFLAVKNLFLYISEHDHKQEPSHGLGINYILN